MGKNGKKLSFHNQSVMENLLDNFQKEVLKLRLAYDYAGRNGFDSTADFLLGECVSFMEEYVTDFETLFDCVSHGRDMNLDDEEVNCSV